MDPSRDMWKSSSSSRRRSRRRVTSCVEIKLLRRVRAESSRRPPRHRRGACSMAVLMPVPHRSTEPARPRHRRGNGAPDLARLISTQVAGRSRVGHRARPRESGRRGVEGVRVLARALRCGGGVETREFLSKEFSSLWTSRRASRTTSRLRRRSPTAPRTAAPFSASAAVREVVWRAADGAMPGQATQASVFLG